MVPLSKYFRFLLASQTPLGVLATKISTRFTTWPVDEFSRFTRSAAVGPANAGSPMAQPPPMPPLQAPDADSIAPGTFELRFTQLQQDRAFDQMWDLIAEDARRAWGGRGRFLDAMSAREDRERLLRAKVGRVAILEQWTDAQGGRTYRGVARVSVHYRIRDGWRELDVNRDVHLIPAAGGWRTLYYPIGD